jgi:tetratricopeptide (TPR) repeat protein
VKTKINNKSTTTKKVFFHEFAFSQKMQDLKSLVSENERKEKLSNQDDDDEKQDDVNEKESGESKVEKMESDKSKDKEKKSDESKDKKKVSDDDNNNDDDDEDERETMEIKDALAKRLKEMLRLDDEKFHEMFGSEDEFASTLMRSKNELTETERSKAEVVLLPRRGVVVLTEQHQKLKETIRLANESNEHFRFEEAALQCERALELCEICGRQFASSLWSPELLRDRASTLLQLANAREGQLRRVEAERLFHEADRLANRALEAQREFVCKQERRRQRSFSSNKSQSDSSCASNIGGSNSTSSLSIGGDEKRRSDSFGANEGQRWQASWGGGGGDDDDDNDSDDDDDDDEDDGDDERGERKKRADALMRRFETFALRTAESLAAMLHQRGRHGEAIDYWRRTLDECERVEEADSARLVDVLGGLARTYQAHGGRNAEAADVFRRQIMTQLRRGDDVDPESAAAFARTLSSVGAVYRDEGRLAEAMELFERTIAQQRRAGNEHSFEYAASLNNKANVLKDLGRLDEAVELFGSAVAIMQRRACTPTEKLALASVYANAALAYRKQLRFDDAAKFYLRSVALAIEGAATEKHTLVAQGLQNLGSLYLACGKLVDAHNASERALALRFELLGELHPDYIGTLGDVATVSGQLGRHAQSLDMFARAIELWRRASITDHHRHATVLYNMACTLQLCGSHRRALATAQQAVDIWHRSATGSRCPDAELGGLLHVRIAACHEQLGGLGDARGALERALDIWDGHAAIASSGGGSDESEQRDKKQRHALVDAERLDDYLLAVGSLGQHCIRANMFADAARHFARGARVAKAARGPNCAEAACFVGQHQRCMSLAASLATQCHCCGHTCATSLCSRCKQARYCSVACQHKDWSNHRLFCAKAKR